MIGGGRKCDGGGWSGEREGSATSADVNADVSRMWVADDCELANGSAARSTNTSNARRCCF